MKKFFTSKGFIITSLAVLCVAILGVCWYAGLDKSEPFVPDESPPAASAESEWTEADTQAWGENSSAAYPTPQESTQSTEEYPKVIEESKDEVIIDFTSAEAAASETTLPPPPENTTVEGKPDSKPEDNPTPEVTAPDEKSSADNEPTPGSSNGNGAVYDPVFGWIVPSEGQQTIGHSDGDINKMVGNMGQ